LILEHSNEGIPFDYLILDWIMPEKDGVSTLKELKRLENSGKIKELPTIIMVTAHSKHKLLTEIEREHLSFHNILTKPITSSSIYNALLKIDELIGLVHHHDDNDTFAGKRILLVEDNQINQLVATKNLEKFRVIIDIAQNGQEAVEMAEKSSYDLVLMDIQMPIMDGFEATKLIRKKLSSDKLPIVAMSAAVMKEDVENSLNVGMNDHLAKPFKKDDLKNILTKWLDREDNNDESFEDGENNQIQEETLNKIIDFELGVDYLDGDEELFIDLLVGFKDSYSNIDVTIQELIDNGELAEAKKVIHTLKGLSGQICAIPLHEEVKTLESMLLDERVPELSNLKELLHQTVDEIQVIEDGESSAPTLSRDINECHDIINSLEEKLAHADIIEDSELSSVKDCLENRVDEVGFRKFVESVDNFDYNRAVQLLKDLKDELFR
jgi:CheY-like chemotaxis protein/HPt (histidine-containing phosphotransfer) domain-containing protein